MKHQPIIIADADALIAIINKDDIHAFKILSILEKLSLYDARILIPTSAIAEAASAIQRKLSNPLLTVKLIEMIKRNDLVIKAVGEEIMNEAFRMFDQTKSKRNTLFDAIIAASANFYKADAMLSFDSWYQKIGSNLASDLVEE